jgi:hypothetical protein
MRFWVLLILTLLVLYIAERRTAEAKAAGGGYCTAPVKSHE